MNKTFVFLFSGLFLLSTLIFSSLAVSSSQSVSIRKRMEPIFVLHDPAGDDHGSGHIRYPSDKLFIPGSFDLLSLEVAQKKNFISFKITLNAPIQPPPHLRISDNIDLRTVCKEKFFLQNIDIYIDTGDPKDEGAIWLLPGRKAELINGARWTRLVVFTPQPQSARSKLIRLLKNGLIQSDLDRDSPDRMSAGEARRQAENFIDDRIWFASRVDVQKRSMTIDIPSAWFDRYHDVSKWKVLVTVTGAAFTDSFDLDGMISGLQPEGNLYVREITPLGGSWSFGGATGLPGESNLIDITTPPGQSQEKLLNGFSRTHRCRLPMSPLKLIN